jgi:conjugative transfer signal peptidase TraF
MARVIPLTFVAAPAAVVAVALGAGLAGIRINTSPSLPMGLYRITADPAASLVEFCPPMQYDQSSVARGYRTSGMCPDGGAPLLKPVIARAGDVVELSEAGIAVNGNVLPHTAARAVDSSYNDYSYDSRYFGPVPTAAILHPLRPVCTLYSYETGVRSSRSR